MGILVPRSGGLEVQKQRWGRHVTSRRKHVGTTVGDEPEDAQDACPQRLGHERNQTTCCGRPCTSLHIELDVYLSKMWSGVSDTTRYGRRANRRVYDGPSAVRSRNLSSSDLDSRYKTTDPHPVDIFTGRQWSNVGLPSFHGVEAYHANTQNIQANHAKI